MSHCNAHGNLPVTRSPPLDGPLVRAAGVGLGAAGRLGFGLGAAGGGLGLVGGGGLFFPGGVVLAIPLLDSILSPAPFSFFSSFSPENVHHKYTPHAMFCLFFGWGMGLILYG